MSDIKITRDAKLIQVLAAQHRNERVDSDKIEEANQIIMELAQDLNPQNAYQIGQAIAFTVEELQKHALDFLGTIADTKDIGYGDKALFNVRLGSIKAYIQAKGGTTARSMITDKQILVPTKEVSARPAMNIIDLHKGKINIADLIREANDAITEKKMEVIESVLQAAIAPFGSPWYANSTGGLNQATLDAQILHFRRLGPVNLVGDLGAVSQLAPFTGMAANSVPTMAFSGNMLDEHARNGFLGNYNGCAVTAFENGYKEDGVTPILNPNWIYIIPGAASKDARNLKVVNEGGVNQMPSQNIDSRTYEVLLYTWFGAAFVVGKNPTIGAHFLN